MSARPVPSWQITLCDLSLILFLTALAGLQGAPAQPGRAQTLPMPSARSHEMAVYRDGAGGLSLSQWLAQHGTDPRAQLTVMARFAPGELDQVARRAADLARQAAEAGKQPRLVVEPAAASDVIVSLAYDAAGSSSHAQATLLRPAVLAR